MLYLLAKGFNVSASKNYILFGSHAATAKITARDSSKRRCISEITLSRIKKYRTRLFSWLVTVQDLLPIGATIAESAK